MRTKAKIGDTIRIIEMKGEPQMSRFMKQLRKKTHHYFAH